MTDQKRVLIVDDEPDMREYLTAFFTDNGYAVETANDGVEALTKVEAAAPDLVTLDVTMPEKSGVKFYREMKEDETRRSIPVIMITGVSGDFKKFISSRKKVPPPDGYVPKPVDLTELLKVANKLTG